MAPSSGMTDSPLLEELLAHGHQFSFVQVLRLARRYLQQHGGVTPPEVPWQDRVRIRPELSLAFPAADVAKVEGDAAELRITATFLGLYGSASPLPTFFTEELLEEQAGDGSVLRHFFDVVHQRLYHLYFECWSKYNLLHQVVEENSAAARQRLFCLIGLGEKELAESVPEAFSLLRYAGLLSLFPRSASGLQSLLRDSLKEPNIRILQNIHRRVPIPEDQRLRLGLSGCRLGVDAVLGSHMDDVMGKFRIAIGPLSWEDYNSLVPGTPRYLKLCRLVAFYLPDPLEYDLELILAAGQARPLRLGDPEARLGLNTWCFAGDTLGELRTRFPSAPWPDQDTAPEGATLPDPRPAAPEGTLADLYRRERAGLTDQIERFVAGHPNLAPMVSGPHADPGVERLLEGTALYCALLRRKLEDDVPEVIQEITETLHPWNLRPNPAATLVAFTPRPEMQQPQTIRSGAEILSVPIEGTCCRFRTCPPVTVHPFVLEQASFDQPPGQSPAIRLRIRFTCGVSTRRLPNTLRLHLGDDHDRACDLYLLLTRHLRRIVVLAESGAILATLPPEKLVPVDFADAAALEKDKNLAFASQRVLQSYFHFPEAFLFLELTGLPDGRPAEAESVFEIAFELAGSLPLRPKLTQNSFLLHAAMAVNLFANRAKPIHFQHKLAEHPIQPEGIHSTHYHVHSVDAVRGFINKSGSTQVFHNLNGSPRKMKGKGGFQIKKSPSPFDRQIETFITIPADQLEGPDFHIRLDMDLTCTNGRLPERLQPGDLGSPGRGMPEFVAIHNPGPVIGQYLQPWEDNRQWRLLSGFSLHMTVLRKAANLRAVLRLYLPDNDSDPTRRATMEAHIAAITAIQVQTGDRLMGPEILRGYDITLTLNPQQFTGPGAQHLFGAVLNDFLAGYVKQNFTLRLTVQTVDKAQRWQWPTRMGLRSCL